MSVRRARIDDRDAIASIAMRSGIDGYSPRMIEEELERPHAAMFVDEVDEIVVGFALAWCVADEGSLLAIAVDTAARKRGVGRRLLSATEGWAVSKGAISMLLEVRASNESARSYYQHAGYFETGVRKSYYANGEDAVLLARLLT